MTPDQRLNKVVDALHSMASSASEFEQLRIEFQGLREYAGNDFMMMHYDPNAVQQKADIVTKRLMEARHNIMRHADDVTAFLVANGLASIWKVFPPPAIGGVVRNFNIFESFIDMNLESSARPKLIQINDLLNKALLICERQMREYEENPPNVIAEGVKKGTRSIGAIGSWFFPSQVQRTILGWIAIVFLVSLLLRYIFGFHLEDLGRLVTKWAFK